jgi:hypothetical protein
VPPPPAPRTPAPTRPRGHRARLCAETAVGAVWARSRFRTQTPAASPLALGHRVLRTTSPQVTGHHQEPGPAPAAPAARSDHGRRPPTGSTPGLARRRSVSRHLTGSLCTDRCWSSCRSAEYTLRNDRRDPARARSGAGAADVTDGGTCRGAPPRGWPGSPWRLPLCGHGYVPPGWPSGPPPSARACDTRRIQAESVRR